MCENVLKIKPPLMFALSDAEEVSSALHRACQELDKSLASVDIGNSKCMEATAHGRAEAARYFEALFQDCQATFCNAES